MKRAKKPKTLRHFPVYSRGWPDFWFIAQCGYESKYPGEFVDPRQYKTENLLPCCQTEKKSAAKESA